MPKDLKTELKQNKEFPSKEEELFLNIIRTADSLQRSLVELFKRFDLSPTQYNMLRILRGAGEHGSACGEIGERMVTRDPDITRLVDRLEGRGLVQRSRENKDRRVITTRITEDGLKLLAQIDQPVTDAHHAQLGHLTKKQMQELIDLLGLARDKVN